MLMLIPNSIIFTAKDTKLYVPLYCHNISKRQPKLLSKGFERSLYWNKYKTESENKNMTNKYRYFSIPNFVGINRLLV